ncbi:MAG TPA: PAS domain-containing protein [Solirubrobacteraceae bacterium]|jgi:PAS domain S-box-containing protein|nr:PAS domain-containing protein [Solirubrobacteraceae bacterium]
MPESYALLDALFAHAPIGLAFWDSEQRYRRVNPALAAMNGVAPDDHVGRTPPEVVGPELGDRVRALLRKVQQTGTPLVDLPIEGTTPAAPGELRHWTASYYPVPGEAGEVLGVAAVVVERTGERQARRAEQAATAILDAIFSAAPIGLAFWDLDQRYRRVNPGLAQLNGVSAEAHLGRTPSELLGELGTRIEELLRTVVRTGEAVVDEEIDSELEGRPIHRQATLFPVRGADADVVGVAGVVRDVTAQHEAETERTQLLREALTARAQAEAAQVRAEAAQQEAEAARRRTEVLAAAGARLAAVVTDYEATLREVARVAVPAIADWCTFTLVESPQRLRTVAVAAADPQLEALAREMADRYPPSADAPHGVGEVIRTGRTQFVREIPEELLASIAQDPEHLAFLRRMGMRSGMIVPIKARGRTIGALSLVAAESGRTYGEDDLRVAELLAARAALSVENARLYEQHAHIARTLQRSLLPPALPDVPGLELAARYRAAGDQNEVGGDFYDVFRGADDTWTLLIGDVAGKGPEAAAVTSLTRHTLRAMTLRGAGARECLHLLNDALLREPAVGGRFCTTLYARVCPQDDGRVTMTLATGGHLPPRVLRADGTVERLDLRGAIVGGLRNPKFAECDEELRPGDVLLLFTDGVTELRGRDPGAGERMLDALLAEHAGAGPAELVEAIEQRVVALQGGEPRDDIALLAARPVGLDSR